MLTSVVTSPWTPKAFTVDVHMHTFRGEGHIQSVTKAIYIISVQLGPKKSPMAIYSGYMASHVHRRLNSCMGLIRLRSAAGAKS